MLNDFMIRLIKLLHVQFSVGRSSPGKIFPSTISQIWMLKRGHFDFFLVVNLTSYLIAVTPYPTFGFCDFIFC